MQDFSGKLAVITGGGTGIGRALCKQLASEGCSVAMCDISQADMDESCAYALDGAPQGVRVTGFLADVAIEDQINAFRDDTLEQHDTDHIHLLFNNAGIGGGGSFVNLPRDVWERTFGVCWYGVYYSARAFLPALKRADEGHMINVSSVNGFWASLGPDTAHTAYSAAKFAVKGFTEALVNDFKLNAPHLKASVVMPGHIGTNIALNTMREFGE
ncbi:MAG: SDR family oxidoreductase, partial [Pseudomonadota bacterium]